MNRKTSTPKSVSGPILAVPEMPNAGCKQLWGSDAGVRVGPPADGPGENGGTTIYGSIESGGVVMITVGASR